MLSLQADGLTKKYNRHFVFKDLSFFYAEGVLGISGSNGSGKSTLLKSLSYLIGLNEGTMIWKKDGQTLTKDEIKPLIGYAAPYINLYSEMTASENLGFLLELSFGRSDKEQIARTLEYVQMSGFEDTVLKNLSTGQNQRIKLAAALIKDPGILMLDEPGSNLDEKGQELVGRIIRDQQAKGTAVILASNDDSEIALCDQTVRL